MHLLERSKRFLEVWQLILLLIVASTDTLSALPPRFALFQCNIVEGATVPQNRFHCLFLLRGWFQFVIIGFAVRRLVAHSGLFLHSGKKTARVPLVLCLYRQLWAVFVVHWTTRLSSPCLQGRGLQPDFC